MAQGPPNRWDSETKYWYRKLSSLNNWPLIDKLDECKDMLTGKKPINPPYTNSDIQKMARAILYILKYERGLDIQLAKDQFKWLEEEVQKDIDYNSRS